ncbi:MAG: TRAP transporter fused permease subunit [Desulfobacterales bacterium]|nr:TRAP transporter fused permease subunit [Desulfobacterales bacterium]
MQMPSMSEKHRLVRLVDVLITILAVGLVVYEVLAVFMLIFPPIPHLNTFLMLVLLLTFLPDLQLALQAGKKGLLVVSSLFIALSLVGTVYVFLFYQDLQVRVGFTTTTDIVIGIIILVVLFNAAGKAFGAIVPIIVGCFIGYAFLSSFLPPPFYQPAFSLARLISWLVTGLSEGVYGGLLSLAADVIFLFILFGSMLEITHAQELFTQIGFLVGSKMRGGAAQAAVVSSALVGTICGSGSANVVITGTFTIPMMKKTGFRPEVAAAVEAIASTGGMLIPPVMGSIAFVMSGITGIPYLKICGLAVIPALVYYLSIMWAVHVNASKNHIPYSENSVDIRYILHRLHIFVVPFGVITALLVMEFSPNYAAGWAIVSAFAVSFLHKQTRPTLSSLIQGLRKGAINASQLGVTLALLGTTLSVIEITGVGHALTTVVELWSQGFLPLALGIVMIMNIILGSLAPGFATYLILALTTGPLLMKLGLTLEQAHFFIVYYACIGMVTPPVGPAALIASGIAGTGYLKTGLRAFQFSLGALLMPFLFVYQPALLAQFSSGSELTGIVSIAFALCAVAMLQVIIERFLFTRLSLTELLLAFISMIAMMVYIFTHGDMIALVTGLACFTGLILSQRARVKVSNRPLDNSIAIA